MLPGLSVLKVPLTSRFMELQRDMCIKSKAEVIIEYTEWKLQSKTKNKTNETSECSIKGRPSIPHM